LNLAQALCKGRESNCTARAADVTDPKQVDEIISNHNVVISLLPNIFNVMVSELCLKHKKHLVTASYIPPKMKEMHSQ
jgi:saccharopine dehydrogenase-like NADP-dependent oxidoreductase